MGNLVIGDEYLRRLNSVNQDFVWVGNNIDTWLDSIPKLLRPMIKPLIPQNEIQMLKDFLKDNKKVIHKISQHLFHAAIQKGMNQTRDSKSGSIIFTLEDTGDQNASEVAAFEKYLSDLSKFAKACAPKMKDAENIKKMSGVKNSGHLISDEPQKFIKDINAIVSEVAEVIHEHKLAQQKPNIETVGVTNEDVIEIDEDDQLSIADEEDETSTIYLDAKEYEDREDVMQENEEKEEHSESQENLQTDQQDNKQTEQQENRRVELRKIKQDEYDKKMTKLRNERDKQKEKLNKNPFKKIPALVSGKNPYTKKDEIKSLQNEIVREGYKVLPELKGDTKAKNNQKHK